MKVIQIHTLLNTATSEMLGKEGIVKEDLSNIIGIINSEPELELEPEPEPEPKNYWDITKEPWHSYLTHLGDGVFINSSDKTSFAFMTMYKLGVDVGEDYTLSFEIKVTDDIIQFRNNRLYVNSIITRTPHNNPTLIKDEWVKVFSTFNYLEEDRTSARLYFTEIPSINSIEFRNFKLEKG